MEGVQFSFLGNATKEIEGAQATIFLNYATKIKGVQIGLLNIADTIDGVALGLVNLASNGYIKPEIFYSDINDINISFKSGIQHFYTILRGSYTYRPSYARWSYGLGFGTSWNLIKDKLSTDLNYTANVYNFNDIFTSSFNLHSHIELNLAYTVWNHIQVFAGPSYNYFLSESSFGHSPSEFIPNSVIGTNGSNRSDTWLGFQFGLRL